MESIMAKEPFPILITGATGKQGGAVAGMLIGKGHTNLRVLTRHPENAQVYKEAGVEIVKGDLTDKPSLIKALKGMKKMFLVTTPYEHGVDVETEQGITAINAANEAGIEHLVYSSVASAHRETGIPHFESKWKIEHHLVKSGIPYTIIRPVFFFENFEAPWMLPAIQSGTISLPVKADVPVQMISVQNVGEFVAAAFLRPDEFIGQQFDIAGDSLTYPEALKILGEKTGRSIRYEVMPLKQAESVFGHDFTLMFDWFNRVGYDVDIPTLRQSWDMPLTKFRDWIGISKMPVEL
jgi:uncharacterized protein YbjT (DUF2867 family)